AVLYEQCLHAAEDGGGAAAELAPCSSTRAQRWALRGEVADATGDLCLQSPWDEGDQLTVEGCASSPEQRWTLWSKDDAFACVPVSCESVGADCGLVDDGCEGTINCGS